MSGSAAGLRATVRGSAGTAGAAVVVVLALVVGMLSACSASPGTPGSLPTTTTPIGTASASRMPSTEPGDDEAQIEAAVRAYYEAMDQAVKTGDTTTFLSVTTGDCPCRRFSTSVKAKFAKGELVGAGVSVLSVNVRKSSATRAVVGTAYATTAYKEIAADGTTRSFHGSHVQSSVVLVAVASGWLVSAEHVLERT